ncbi:hypothetical protein FIV42_00830 [Persicimonas caeni]|uniref:Uncharacterized protein n=1 Tax=Persicimonas caeni TaxID=2292766 RepID=A0A4Y6PM79_PERCE|nr:hypothetical protein [Persicimonas caeni]QDG49329.1 hypothetical protein FIV42_00830 [Persicimonas caeni]QED30550.1 hypothetical protein FRD00_00825 [Persicimonas caeni]
MPTRVFQAVTLSCVLLAVGGGMTCCSTPQSPPANQVQASQSGERRAGQMRAMWLWSESPNAQALIENADGAADELFEFLRAPHGREAQAVDRLYFEARNHNNDGRLARLRRVTYDPIGDEDERPALRAFLRRAHQQGVAVEYLDGQAIWLASEQNAKVPVRICRDIVDFNLATDDAEARFDGVHFDIEPHTVTEGPHAGMWWEERLPNGYNREWTARWKRILDSCRDSFAAYEQKTGQHLTLAVDVGADLAHYNAPMRRFLDQVDAPTDYVTVLNYYDNRPNRDGEPSFFHGAHDGNGVVGGVEQNLDLWRHTPVVFGVETGPERIAPDACSFYQEGYEALYGVLDELRGRCRARAGAATCAGAAIHHFGPDAYRQMRR